MPNLIWNNNRLTAGGGLHLGYVQPTPSGPPTDYDGNVYQTVTIGSQVWMKEYLRTEHYNDGTPIPNLTNATDWGNDTTGAFCYYDNDEATYKVPYGALYNWYAMTNPSGLAPVGWRIPTESDFNTLMTTLGGTNIAGKAMKATGTTYWSSPNAGTNTSQFTALGTGSRTLQTSYIFDAIKAYGSFGSQTSIDATFVRGYVIYHHSDNLFALSAEKKRGVSIRCIKI